MQLFQKRENGTLDFYQDWQAYKDGFGHLQGEHWLGNDKLHRLTVQKPYALRVNLWDWEGQSAYALYDNFTIGSADQYYILNYGEYDVNSTAGEFIRLKV